MPEDQTDSLEQQEPLAAPPEEDRLGNDPDFDAVEDTLEDMQRELESLQAEMDGADPLPDFPGHSESTEPPEDSHPLQTDGEPDAVAPDPAPDIGNESRESPDAAAEDKDLTNLSEEDLEAAVLEELKDISDIPDIPDIPDEDGSADGTSASAARSSKSSASDGDTNDDESDEQDQEPRDFKQRLVTTACSVSVDIAASTLDKLNGPFTNLPRPAQIIIGCAALVTLGLASAVWLLVFLLNSN